MRVTKADRRAKSKGLPQETIKLKGNVKLQTIHLEAVNPLYGQGTYDTHGSGLPIEQAKALTKNYRVPHGTGRLTVATKRHKVWSKY